MLLVLCFVGLVVGLLFLFLLGVCVFLFVVLVGLGFFVVVIWYWICVILIGVWILLWWKDDLVIVWSICNSGFGFVFIGSFIGFMVYFLINILMFYLLFFSGWVLLVSWCFGVWCVVGWFLCLCELLVC